MGRRWPAISLVSLVALALGAGCRASAGRGGDASTTGDTGADGNPGSDSRAGGDSVDADGDAGAAASPATAAEMNALCQAQCDWAMRCGFGTGGTACVATCVAKGGDPAASRSDAVAATASCYGTVACSAGTAACVEEGLVAVNPLWREDALFTTCTAKAEGCQGSGAEPFSNDNCAYAITSTNVTRAKLAVCYSGACADLEACFRAALGIPAPR